MTEFGLGKYVGLAKVLSRLCADPDIRGASKDMRRAS
jgi:hypothetical protein